jgi:hypothetical protein
LDLDWNWFSTLRFAVEHRGDPGTAPRSFYFYL